VDCSGNALEDQTSPAPCGIFLRKIFVTFDHFLFWQCSQQGGFKPRGSIHKGAHVNPRSSGPMGRYDMDRRSHDADARYSSGDGRRVEKYDRGSGSKPSDFVRSYGRLLGDWRNCGRLLGDDIAVAMVGCLVTILALLGVGYLVTI